MSSEWVKVIASASPMRPVRGKSTRCRNTYPRHVLTVSFTRGEGSLRLCAEGVRDRLPVVDERIRRRQVEHEAPHRDDHVRAELEQPLAQRLNLRSRARGSGGTQPELLHEDVRRGGHEHPKLIRPETRAARPVDLQPALELLHAVLRIPALAV